jgi:hypothetical protein
MAKCLSAMDRLMRDEPAWSAFIAGRRFARLAEEVNRGWNLPARPRGFTVVGRIRARLGAGPGSGMASEPMIRARMKAGGPRAGAVIPLTGLSTALGLTRKRVWPFAGAKDRHGRGANGDNSAVTDPPVLCCRAVC